MAYVVGVVLFALGILVSVALHEAGHMWSARAFGMKVTRFFVGFGPTLFAFKRGDTEYGVKAIPAGAFVKIVGMTPEDDDVPEGEEHRAMWKYPVWKRTIVLSAGSATHFILGFILLWITLAFVGVPNPALADPQPAVIDVKECVVPSSDRRDCQPGDPVSPAKIAGLQTGDKILKVGGNSVANIDELLIVLAKTQPGPTPILVERNGQVLDPITVNLSAVERMNADGKLEKRAGVGIGFVLTIPEEVVYGPVDAVGQSVTFTGNAFVATWEAMKRFPEKIPALWRSLTGEQRDPETPISVVGASRLGGETVENDAWSIFLLILVSLNFFVGVFNLLPLLPLDGGHIAIAWFERARSWLYARLGRDDPGRVDYYKLMPVTYAVILIFGAFTLLTVAADIVNPITLFG